MSTVAQRSTFAVAALVVLAAVLASCRSATEIVVEARTNAAYHDGFVVSFTVGTPDELEAAAPTTESRAAWGVDGFVGSLTVVPSSGSSKDTALGVKIVLGVDRDSRSCTPPDYRGCIVARRRIHYTAHERLVLPIALYVECKDVACDAASTCNLLGQCVSATVDPATCSAPQGCTVSGDPQASMPPAADSGPSDAANDGVNSNDATNDALGPPAGDSAVDAPVDASPDATTAGTPGKVDCGPGKTCDLSLGLACCFDSTMQSGICVTSGTQCMLGAGIYLFSCDGPEDCVAGSVCCAYAGGVAQCSGGGNCGPYDPVCHSTHTCPTGACASSGFALGYYQTCQ